MDKKGNGAKKKIYTSTHAVVFAKRNAYSKSI